jgi:hypothetical protein
MMKHFFFQAVLFLAFLILLSVGSIAHPAIVVIDPGHGGRDRVNTATIRVLTIQVMRRFASGQGTSLV